MEVESNKQIAQTDRNQEIALAREAGETYASLAKRFNLSISRISRICARDRELKLNQIVWQHHLAGASYEQLAARFKITWHHARLICSRKERRPQGLETNAAAVIDDHDLDEVRVESRQKPKRD